MTNDEFKAFSLELAARFRESGHRWIVAVMAPEQPPHSAGNMSTDAQILFLRGLADSLERNSTKLVQRVEIEPPP